MGVDVLRNAFEERKPITKAEIQKVLNIDNKHTLNQMTSNLVTFGILRRYENGIYYIPSSSEKFSKLKPSLKDVVYKKYLQHNQGIRTGSYLLYKYKFTSQVSSFYEILSNKVSSHTRSKQLYDGKVIVSYPPFEIHKNNIEILEFLELVKHRGRSDYSIEKSMKKLRDVIKEAKFKKEELIRYSEYYKGRRHAGFRKTVREVVADEATSQ